MAAKRQRGAASGTGRTAWARALFTGAVLALGLAVVASDSATARVDPLPIIARQIHRPNMLVVFDTSGSLTGVPGGSFSTSTEVGVDCDDGVNCRGGVAKGLCDQTQ